MCAPSFGRLSDRVSHLVSAQRLLFSSGLLRLAVVGRTAKREGWMWLAALASLSPVLAKIDLGLSCAFKVGGRDARHCCLLTEAALYRVLEGEY